MAYGLSTFHNLRAQKRSRLSKMVTSMAMLGAVVGTEAWGTQVPEMPALESRTMVVDGLSRTYQLYVPEHLSSEPAVVLGLHGARGNGDRFRYLTDQRLEKKARESGWIMLYPDAYKGGWNDCRKPMVNAAKVEGVDDVKFLAKLLASVQQHFGARGVYITGFSNGGHMAYRLVADGAVSATAIAMIGAHVPAPSDSLCPALKAPQSVLIASGTKDPVNPYEGGDVMLEAVSLGRVLSASASARHFLQLPPEIPPASRAMRSGEVEAVVWRSASGKAEARLLTLVGNGHVIAGTDAVYPAFVGPNVSKFPLMDEVWRFFQQQNDAAAQHAAAK